MLPGSKLKSIALCVILALCLHSTEGDVSDQNQAVSHREKGRGGFLAATGSFRLSGLVPREEERSLGERNVAELDSADDLLDGDDQFETNDELQKRKVAAVAVEDYELAAVLKKQISTLKDLEQRKVEAVAVEDYELAAVLKKQIAELMLSILGKHVPKDCPAIVKIKHKGMQAFMKETWHCKSGNYCLGKAATYFNRGKMAEYLENDEAIFQSMYVKDFGKAGFCVLKRGYGISSNKAGLAMMVYSKLACTEDNICINSSKKFYGGFELSHRHYSSSKKSQCFDTYKGCRYFADRMRNGKFKMVPSNEATSGLTQAFMMA